MLANDTQYRNTLLERLNAHFGLDEVNTLCFKLGLDSENLPGNTKQGRLTGLFKRLDEKGIDTLLDEARKLRSDLDLPMPPWRRAEAIAAARRMERKHAYREAVAKWQELLDEDPDDPDADNEILRLKDKIFQTERLSRCKKDIFKSKNEIAPILDSLLEDAFDAKEKKYVQVSHARNNEETGDLLLKYHDKDEPEQCLIDELSGLKLLEKGFSVIYKLRGCFKLTRAPQGDALLLSERDYFRFARYVDKLIPSYITRQLGKSGLWLLDHYPCSWEDRLLTEAILAKRGNQEQALTVHNEPDNFARAYWEFHHVKNYPLSLEDFVTGLKKHL
ncbi:MAG: hypothetical protein GY862_16910 [Gammaproteobacteria bacterium]|nr:hypothetical protein [Gammaproteobacteria bacterium]